MNELIDLAERLAKSSLLPEALRGKVPEVMMQIMAGQELGLHSMVSLRSFHVISGKPVMASDAMVAIVLGSGKAEYFRRVGEGSDTSVTYATRRKGSAEEQRCTWTIEMAKRASLNTKDTWRAYPRAMLASRAKSDLARDVYPDVLAGCYSEDEISHGAPNAPKQDAEDVEFVEVHAPAPAAVPPVAVAEVFASIEAAQSLGPTWPGMDALANTGNAHPSYVAEIKRRYAERKLKLTQLAAEEKARTPSKEPDVHPDRLKTRPDWYDRAAAAASSVEIVPDDVDMGPDSE